MEMSEFNAESPSRRVDKPRDSSLRRLRRLAQNDTDYPGFCAVNGRRWTDGVGRAWSRNGAASAGSSGQRGNHIEVNG